MNELRIETHGVNLHNDNTGRSMKFKKATITENIANPERATAKQRINTEKRKRAKNTARQYVAHHIMGMHGNQRRTLTS